MQVNLSNVHIPLQQFHEVASGQQYAVQTVKLGIGDALFLYTDGVTEAMDEKGELFGEQRTLEALNAVETPDAHALCGVVRSVVAAFSEGLQQADDMTVLAVRYLRPPTVYSRAFPPTQEGIAAASRFLDDVLGKSAWREARVTGLGILMIKKMASSVQYHRSRSRNFLVVERTEQT